MAVQLQEDFNGTTGASWSASNWTTGGTAGVTATIDTNRGKVVTATSTATNYFRGSLTNQNRQYQEMLVKIVKSGTANAWAIGLNSTGVWQSGGNVVGAYPDAGYRVYGPGNGTTATVQRITAGGVQTSLTTTLAAGASGATIWIRMQFASDNILRVRTWTDGASEPTTWTYTSAVQTPLGAGLPFVAVNANSGSSASTTYFDSITIDDLVAATPVNVTILESPATATAASPSAVTSGSANYVPAPMTASSTAVHPAVAAVKNVSTTAPALTASATAPTGVASGSATFVAGVMVATGALIDPTESAQRLVAFVAPVATATATIGTATPSASSVVSDDFGTETTGAAPLDFTKRGANGNLLVTDVAGTASGKALADTVAGSNGFMLYTRNDVGASAVADVLVSGVRQSGILISYVSTSDYYMADYDYTNQTLNLRNASGVVTSVSAPINVPSGFFWLRANINHGVIKVKAWVNGAAEPATWSINTTVVDRTGTVGLAAYDTGVTYYQFFSANTTGGAAPTLSLGKEINAVALTASAVMTNPAVGVGSSREVGAATASASMTNALVELERAIIFGAGAMSASAEIVEPAVYTPDVTNFAGVMEASATATEPSVSIRYNREVSASAMTATADAVQPAFTNMTDISISAAAMKAAARIVYYTEEDDPFVTIIRRDFGSIAPATVTPDLWLRFGQLNTTPLKNYALIGTPETGSWVGTPDFQILDDFNRKATHFDADAYALLEQNPAADYGQTHRALTWEVVFRTTHDGPLFTSEVSDALGRMTMSNLSVIDGRVNTHGFGATSVRVDDGQWHHVLVTIGSRGLEIFVDGVSRLIRRAGGLNAATAAIPTAAIPIERVGTNAAGTQFFNGDILTVAQYSRELPREAGSRHYYAYVMATVVEPGVGTAVAQAGNNKGRGNGLKALALYSVGGELPTVNSPNWTGLRLWTLDSRGLRVYNDAPFAYGKFTVFPRQMTIQRNEYDYSPRLFNMDDVPDLADYDLFFFVDVPGPHMTLDDTEVTGQSYDLSDEYEVFVASIRAAIDSTGISFWCPNPQLAADLGFISGLDIHSLDKEGYDVKSYVEDNPTWKAQVGTQPSWYLDTHYNNKYRINAQVEGLTDVGGYLIDDVVYWRNIGSPFSQRPDYVKWHVRDLNNRGLHIGETIYFPTDLLHRRDTSSYTGQEPWRWKVWSVPEGHYAGTAVAKELATVNMAGADIPNPYSSNALSIVIRPGDSVKGAPIGGKVFVDFMSGYDPFGQNDIAENPYVARQNPPYGTPDYPHMDDFDLYEYDSRRMNAYFETRNVYQEVQQRSGQSANAGRTVTTQNSVSVYSYSEAEKYQTVLLPQFTWLERAFNWLSIKETVEPGSVRVLAARAEATASMPAPLARGQRHAVVGAGAPAQALAQIVAPAEAHEKDVEIRLLPMTATAVMVGTPTVATAGAMKAVATMPEVTVNATGQDYVLQLRTYSTTLFLKEDAQ